MADESKLDQSKEHTAAEKHRAITNRWDFMYRMVRDFGIAVAFATAVLAMFYFQTEDIAEEAKEDKKFIRTELLPMVKDGTKANYEVAESLEDFAKTSAQLADALEDLTKAQVRVQPIRRETEEAEQ